jgi:hypothetical protein
MANYVPAHASYLDHIANVFVRQVTGLTDIGRVEGHQTSSIKRVRIRKLEFAWRLFAQIS